MSVQNIRSQLPDYAKDIKINLGNLLGEEAPEGLTPAQTYGIALSAAYAIKHPAIVSAIYKEAQAKLSAVELNAAKIAATLMGMNNIYYRFVHLSEDKKYAALPAGLRMTAMASHGISATDFELMSLAVSIINGCGMCIEAHVRQAEKHGVTAQGVQSCAKISATLNAAACALSIEALSASEGVEQAA